MEVRDSCVLVDTIVVVQGLYINRQSESGGGGMKIYMSNDRKLHGKLPSPLNGF